MTQNLKIRACFMQNLVEVDIKKFLDPKALTPEVWDLKTSLGQLGPKPLAKNLSSHKFRKLASIFTNRTSFSHES